MQASPHSNPYPCVLVPSSECPSVYMQANISLQSFLHPEPILTIFISPSLSPNHPSLGKDGLNPLSSPLLANLLVGRAIQHVSRVRRQLVRVFSLVADLLGVCIARSGVGFAVDLVPGLFRSLFGFGGLPAGIWGRHFWFGGLGDGV